MLVDHLPESLEADRWGISKGKTVSASTASSAGRFEDDGPRDGPSRCGQVLRLDLGFTGLRTLEALEEPLGRVAPGYVGRWWSQGRRSGCWWLGVLVPNMGGGDSTIQHHSTT